MRFPCLLAFGLLALLAPAAAGQDKAQLDRLASDQRLVAEQVRRLSKLLETLEQRDRAEGRVARADLLGQAAARLESVESGAELASVIESIAGDLAALRTGTALSAQAEAIRTLEKLLEMLLETQAASEQEQRQVDLEKHIQDLEGLRQRQEQLRQKNEELMKDAAQASAAPAKDLEKLAEQQRKLAEEIEQLGADRRSPKAAEAAEHAEAAADKLDQAAEAPATAPQEREQEPASADLAKELEKLAEQQRKLAEQIAQLNRERSSPMTSEAAKQAAETAEKLDQAAGKPASAQLAKELKELAEFERKLAEELVKRGTDDLAQAAAEAAQAAKEAAAKLEQAAGKPASPSQAGQPHQQEQAAQQQKQTEEALKQAIDQAQKELQQLEDRKRMQELENVRMLAEQILTAHRAEEDALTELFETRAESLTRAQRARLRQSSRAEQDLASATQGLLVKIETLGASTFPFFLHSIEMDHGRLASEIGPPRLLVDEHALQVAADLSQNWESLIEAIRIEEERIRRKLEEEPGEKQPGEAQEEAERPLVNFAMELQLLKRMQESLARDLDWTRKKFSSYARAGIEPEAGEDLQLQSLLERQLELRRQFEDMLARMQEAGPTGTEDL